MHGLDYFCIINKITLTELSNYLGISKSAPTNWKNGSKNFPDKYKRILYDLFGIPEDKCYLLEIKVVTMIDRIEIKIIHQDISLKNIFANDDIDVEMKKSLVAMFTMEITLLKNQLRRELLIHRLKRTFDSSIYMNIDKIYNLKLDKLENFIDELEKFEENDEIKQIFSNFQMKTKM
ncbi:hypothetical protein [Psychrobacillus sp. L3]|uniref:hypothetical protein n=1 Tax=Psychrobacillus sp. L3 TaxID=3236891 RepID=UPI0036F30090